MANIIGVRFKKHGKIYFFDPDGKQVKKGEYVIVETAMGMEYGEVVIANRQLPQEKIVAPLKKIVRVANNQDARQNEENKKQEKEAFKICEKKIKEHNLEMKLMDVEFKFDKSKILYNFNRVNFTNNDDTLIICEGFMDCIAYNRAGYTNCVATMGTQITQNHVYLLKSLKFVKTIILSFDNDNAGTIANINNAKFLIDNGYNVTIANYQDFQQKDIDEIILKNGIYAAKKVIEEREDFVSFLIRKKLSIKQPVDKVKNAVDELIEDIISYGNKMLKNQYFKSIAQLANYDLEEIEKEFNKKEQNALSYKQTNYNYSKSYKHQNNNYSSKTNVVTNDEMINEIQKAILDFNNNYEHSLQSISLQKNSIGKKC